MQGEGGEVRSIIAPLHIIYGIAWDKEVRQTLDIEH